MSTGFLIFSCTPTISVLGTPGGSSNPNSGFQPANTSTSNPPPSAPPAGTTEAPGCDLSNQAGGDWGGITCASSSNRDQSFREFLSSGSLITGGTDNLGTVGEINCQPNNEGGILFKISAVVNGSFKPGGGNPNLVVQATGTVAHFHIVHRPVNPGQESAFNGPITAELRGVNGSVNNKRATMTFEDNNGSVTFDGTFDSNWYAGTVQYQNKVRKCASSDSNCRTIDAHRGTLGQFRVPTCKVFFSTAPVTAPVTAP